MTGDSVVFTHDNYVLLRHNGREIQCPTCGETHHLEWTSGGHGWTDILCANGHRFTPEYAR